MTGYERVRVALAGRRPDRVPVGEFALPSALAAALLGRGTEQVPGGGPASWRVVEEAVGVLGLDAVGVVAGAGGSGSAGGGLTGPAWPEEVGYWAGRDLFVWVVVDGPWQGLAGAVGWSQALLSLSGRHGVAGSEAVAEAEGLLLLQLDRTLAEVGRALEAGADGVVLGEDVAYAGGLFPPPSVIRERLWPLWREVVRYCSGTRTARGERPLVCFHSDGSIEDLLSLIREAGFDAVHSLEPEAGMDVARLVGLYRGQLGLWGGLSVDLLVRGTLDRIIQEGKRLARAGSAGGLVVGTCSGVVPEGVPAGNLLAAYRAVTAPATSDCRVGEDDPPCP
ncbi:MAG: uroporphyrinogen decarboxylase family protein [Bacillota bacterium]|nr:uroporphyrinogen decarboxylase family protein [Bacillota bacterium]